MSTRCRVLRPWGSDLQGTSEAAADAIVGSALVSLTYAGPAGGGDRYGLAGLRGLRLPVPDGAVGQDVAVGAPPLDPAAFELVLVQRRVHAALA
jgi:hypothetical protein